MEKKAILIVDDDPMNITALIHILGADYTIYAERYGANSLSTAKRLKPCLILLDIIMPEVSGFDVLEQLKADDYAKNIPVIFITGKTSQEYEDRGRELGAADYIFKPFTEDDVKQRIKKIIEN